MVRDMRLTPIVLLAARLLLDVSGPAIVRAACPAILPAAAVSSFPSSAIAAGGDDSRAPDSSVAESDLAATTSPVWVPPRAVPALLPWETALDLPGRVVTLPFSALGYAAKTTTRYVEDRHLLPRFVSLRQSRFGFSVGAPHLGPGVGFGLAADFKPTLLGNVFSAELAGSTRKYTRTLFALHRGPATLHYEYDWRPRDKFFGYGLGSSDDSMSSFAWRQQRFQLTLTYPWRRNGREALKTQVTAWAGPREVTIRNGRRAPSFEESFPALSGLLNLRQEHLVYGAKFARDTRAGLPHWGHGYLAEAQAERFDPAVDWLTIRSANTVAPHFTRLSFHGETGVSFMRDPHTVRVSARAVTTGAVSGSAPILLPDLASLGADDGLASQDLGRFRDRDLLYGAATYIFPVSTNLEMEFHAETGGVYPRMKDARLSSFRSSYGFSLRPHTVSRVLAAIGADWSPGVFTVRYSLGGVR